MKKQLMIICMLLGLSMQLSVLAQNKDLDIRLSAAKVVAVDGKETLEIAEKAKPGEIIQYTAVYANKSGGDIRNLSPTLPIPSGTELIKDSANPTPSEASTDGGSFQKFPLKRKVKSADGQMVEEEVPLSEYRALRWSVGDLASGKSTSVVARVKITSSRPVKLNTK
jgi:uncharacterized repeat protein (TIGR01451 family)